MTTQNVTRHKFKSFFWLLAAMSLPFLIAQPAQAIDLGYGWTVHGRIRQYFSYNLQNQPETQANDAWDLQMNRQSLYLDSGGSTGPLRWTARFKLVHEFITSYGQRLEDQTARIPGNRADFNGEYDKQDIRELFFDWDISDRVSLRLGRQQVAWGQTDFFHGTDVIEGFDLRWRKFLNPNSEEVRKPQILVNTKIKFPEANGKLQLLVRPGLLGRKQWIGNSDPTFGGRWSNNGAHGFNLASQVQGGVAAINYHYNQIDADTDDPHYGARWRGTFSLGGHDTNYSVDYYHGQGGFFQDPILIQDPLHPKNGKSMQFIYPETDTVGGSLSGYIPVLDSIYRVEVAYTPNRPLSTGNPTPVSDLGGKLLPNQIVKKNGWNFTLGLDTSPRLMGILGTSNASLLSLQMFDYFIPGIDESDKFTRFDGSGYFDEHNTIATAIFNNPYFHSNVNFTLTGLADLTEGGELFIPSVEYQYKRHWRLKVEADLAFGGNTTNNAVGFPPDTASIFGALHNDDQLYTRITYQF